MHERDLERVEAIEFLEDDGDAGLEEEEDTPGEADPDGEGYDDELGGEHLGWTHEGDFEGLQDAGFVDLRACVGVGVAILAHSGGAFGEDHVAAGFLEDEVEEGQEAGVDDELDPIYPAPV